ncbi:hypothetical protein [Streptomyces sp. ML-6]|uniref:hypothetical protein n=1 Tax=Streptomyces sp. ML-6 TaxID=2982693 RepID=UPI0024BFD33B|nr:hypothetical protein [Streptomyces sp. ML-6]MDK0525031.1 hypothetical protein [Streptomyces sp. ML-6]
MSKRTTARNKPSTKREDQRPDVEFNARLNVRLNVPWKLVSTLIGAAIIWLITGQPWML